MVNLEIDRFTQTLERGRRTVKRAIESGGINQDKLLELYDSQGLPPSVVSDFATEQGHSIEVPDGFLAMVADRHQGETKVQKKEIVIDVKATKLDFYEDMEKRIFNSKVIFSDKNQIALENTLFYPEGGGQLGDKGIIEWNNQSSEVVDVQKVGDVVIHHIKGELPSVGEQISGRVFVPFPFRFTRLFLFPFPMESSHFLWVVRGCPTMLWGKPRRGAHLGC